jgi:hypothetical protein
MRRRWVDERDGRRIEHRLAWWYPPALWLLGLVSAARGRWPSEAELLRLRDRCLRVRVLPDGRWLRRRDVERVRD